jgi:hypothetical protein
MDDMSKATGTMNVETAFEFYHGGVLHRAMSESQILSPAKGGNVSFGPELWTIAYLNHRLFAGARAAWEDLPNVCSPILKAALTTKTAP